MSYNDPNIQSAHARLIQETLERERKNKDLKILISKEVQKLQESAQNGEAIDFVFDGITLPTSLKTCPTKHFFSKKNPKNFQN